MEQQVIRELEQNPMLEEVEVDTPIEYEDVYESDFTRLDDFSEASTPTDFDTDNYIKAELESQKDPFEFYKMLWADTDSKNYQTKS